MFRVFSTNGVGSSSQCRMGFFRMATILLVVSFVLVPISPVFAAENLYYAVPANQLQTPSFLSEITSDKHTGAATYSYPVVTPSGRNGIEPSLSLSYSSNETKNTNVIGYGWDISIPYIQRQNKEGVNNLYDESDYISSLDGELTFISIASGIETYKPRFDNGNFNVYELENDVWTVTDKSGTEYVFGSATTTRQDNPSDSTQIYKWMVDDVRDTNDNFMSYEYYKDAGQIYPSKIKYTGNDTTDGLFEVEFLRESRSDDITSHEPAFAVTSNYRIDEIQVKENGSWVRKYAIAYTTGDNGVRSLISTITESGKDSLGTITTLPAVTFTYQSSSFAWTKDANWSVPLEFIRTQYGGDNAVRFTDANGDGLVDLIRGFNSGGGVCNGCEIALNDGDDWVLANDPIMPKPFRLSLIHI